MKSLSSLTRPKRIDDNSSFRLKRSKMPQLALKDAFAGLWRQLFDVMRTGEPWGDVIVCEATEQISVRPACSMADESNRRFERAMALTIDDREYRSELKKIGKLKDKKEAASARKTLDAEFHKAVAAALMDSFRLKAIQKEFNKFNLDDRPFAVLMTAADKGLHRSEFELVWKNRKGLSLAQLKKKVTASKGKPLPSDEREPSEAERRKSRIAAKNKVEQKRIRKAQVERKAAKEKVRAAKAKKKIPTKVERLEPDIPFRSAKVRARCKTAWMKLFEVLHEYSVTAEIAETALWKIDADKGTVCLIPQAAETAERRWDVRPEIAFRIEGFTAESKRLKTPKQKSSLANELGEWITDAVVDAFAREQVEVEYSWFNEEDHPFSVSMTLVAGKKHSEPRLLWSNTKKVRRAKKKPFKQKSAVKQTDYSVGGWQRFYFDDGKTRRFWYIQSKGVTQTIVEGDLGASGKSKARKFKSPKDTKAGTRKAIDAKVADGFIAYAPDKLTYPKKMRREIAKVKKQLAAYEKERGLRIPEQFRRHVLDVNGGSFYDGKNKTHISLPAHPELKKMEIYGILGFATPHPHPSIAEESNHVMFLDGHMPCARGYFQFTIDQAGVVYMVQLDELTARNYDDDNVQYLCELPHHPVAHCFDEFLTRITLFPNDTNAVRKAKPEKTAAQKQADTAKRFAKAREAAESRPLRRFYFDNGDLKKFWNIETKGKQFTTFYGRFGQRPSDTTKKYTSVQDAKKESDKIIQQKLRKGYHEILPETLELKRPKKYRPATTAAVKKFEKELGVSLPEEYRQFLLTQNGGQPVSNAIDIPGVPYIAAVDVEYILGLYSDHVDQRSLHSGMKTAERLLPKGHLIVAHGSDLFTLSLKWKPGCIWWWNHESDDIIEDMSEAANDRYRPSAAHLLANSFDEFLTRIAMFRSEE